MKCYGNFWVLHIKNKVATRKDISKKNDRGLEREPNA